MSASFVMAKCATRFFIGALYLCAHAGCQTSAPCLGIPTAREHVLAWHYLQSIAARDWKTVDESEKTHLANLLDSLRGRRIGPVGIFNVRSEKGNRFLVAIEASGFAIPPEGGVRVTVLLEGYVLCTQEFSVLWNVDSFEVERGHPGLGDLIVARFGGPDDEP